MKFYKSCHLKAPCCKKPLQDRLPVVEKYNNMIDGDYIDDLRDDEIDRKAEIARRFSKIHILYY